MEVGETTAEVRLRCGAPRSIDRWTESDEVDGEIRIRRIEEWIYDGEHGSFPRLLRFVNHRLRSIRALRRH